MDDTIIPPTEKPVDPLAPVAPPYKFFSSGSTEVISTPNHDIASQTTADEFVTQETANKMWAPEVIGKSFMNGGNIAVSMAQDLKRRYDNSEDDPTWQSTGFKDWLNQNGKEIPPDQQWRYRLTDNAGEATAMLAKSKETEAVNKLLQARAKNYPISTFLGTNLPGLIDIDTPAAFMTGGGSKLARAGLAGSRWAQITRGVVAGGLAGTALGTGGYLSDPTADWTMVPLSGMAGMAFGGLGASFQKANAKVSDIVDEFGDNAEKRFEAQSTDYSTATTHDGVFVPDTAEIRKTEAVTELQGDTARSAQAFKPEEAEVGASQKDIQGESGTSIGARNINGQQQPITTIKSTRIQDTIQRAKTWMQQSGIAREYFDNFANIDTKYPRIGSAVRRMQDVIHATGVATDFDRLMRSNSAVAQKLAYDLFESASGIIRNNKNGAGLYRMYQQQLHNTFKDYAPSLDAWMRDQGMGHFSRWTDFKKKNEFDEAVIAELQYRQFKTGQAATNEHILRAADAVDQWSAHDIAVRKGRPGENPEFGTETMQPKSGYYHQSWLGGKMKRLIESSGGRYHWKDIENSLDEIYAQMHPAMDARDRRIYAESVVDRARRSATNISSNIRGALDGDGRAALEDFLVRNGHNRNDIDKLIDRLTGNMETAGQKGNTKRRIDVDLRATTSNGIRIMDLIDTDVYGSLSRRSHAAAGAGALARKGIGSRAELAEYIDAVLEEQGLTSVPKMPGKQGNIKDTILDNAEHLIDKDKHLSREHLEDMFSVFTGKPIEGAISPAFQRVIKLTNLGLLGQLGLTQIAEFGPAAAAVGLRRFFKDLPADLHHAMKDPTSDLSIELKHLGVMEPEENLFRYDQVYSAERAATEDASLWAKGDQMLNRGSRLQGFTSLMFQVRRIQHKMAVTTGVNRIMQTIAGNGGDFATSAARMRDLGFDPAISARIKKYIDNGTVEFKDGEVYKLNLDKWDMGPNKPGTPNDQEDFVIAVNRFVDQQVQRAMIGESSTLFRKGGVASLFWHLKSFPMLAIEKQFMRNVRLADDETMGLFLYGLGMGAVAYSIKQTVNGNTDRLNLEDISKGAFNMSNLTGWAPMFIDPAAFLMGFGMPFNSSGGAQRGAISVPPSLSYMNDLTKMGGAVRRILNPFEDASNGDLKTLQALPIAGRMIGVPFILNAMKEDKPKKKEKPFDPVAAALAKEKEVNKDVTKPLDILATITQ